MRQQVYLVDVENEDFPPSDDEFVSAGQAEIAIRAATERLMRRAVREMGVSARISSLTILVNPSGNGSAVLAVVEAEGEAFAPLTVESVEEDRS